MTEKVRALYNFEAQPDSGELSLLEGDVVTVTNKDIGDGWWEGTNDRGQKGFFPEQYVAAYEDDDEAPPSMAPPPLPPDYSGGGGADKGPEMGWSSALAPQQTAAAPASAAGGGRGGWDDDDWGFPAPPAPAATQQQSSQQAQDWGSGGGNGPPRDYSSSKSNAANTNQGYDGEDWDSDEEFDTHPSGNGGGGGGHLALPSASGHGGSATDISSIGREGSKKVSAASSTGISNFVRFGNPFVKTGGENYLLGKLNVKVQESDIIQVVDNGDDTYSWLNSKPPYSCKISSNKKEKKFGGLKSFIAYQLTPSFNNIQVSRRYKHFDWLHERLEEKFTLIPIPPLPDKQIQGRYEEEFIERRMNQLQSFVDRVTSHPILSQSEVWCHFLTCTDDRRWKDGKRTAEKDPLVGGSLFMTIKAPERAINDEFLDRQLEIFNKFTGRFDGAVKNMFKVCADQTSLYQGSTKREFQTIGKAFLQLGSAMEQDGISKNYILNNAVNCTGEAFEEIAKITDAQAKHDWEPLGDMMHDYRGLLSGWPDVLQIHSGAVAKRKNCEVLETEGKVNKTELTEIGNRTDVMSYAVLAEIGAFHQTRAIDIKAASQKFLRQQIAYYQKVTEKLQDALREFDSC